MAAGNGLETAKTLGGWSDYQTRFQSTLKHTRGALGHRQRGLPRRNATEGIAAHVCQRLTSQLSRVDRTNPGPDDGQEILSKIG
jgi:hypothetical protein